MEILKLLFYGFIGIGIITSLFLIPGILISYLWDLLDGSNEPTDIDDFYILGLLFWASFAILILIGTGVETLWKLF